MAERAVRRGAAVGVRVATGVVASAVAAVVVAAVGFAPVPTVVTARGAVVVDPDPADQTRVCSGSLVRLGDEAGANADVAYPLGPPSFTVGSTGSGLTRVPLAGADGDVASTAPQVLSVPGGAAALAGAQTQEVLIRDVAGLATASCAEPSSSAWLVGGAATVGRTSILLLANPTAVDAVVALEIFGEDGPVAAPGLSGIEVPAGGQRVLSLAGFAPEVVSPVVHVLARGGRVVAALQQSIVRGLDASGVELVGAGADPGTRVVIPGVRIVDVIGTNRSLALADWHDVIPIIRLAVPGADAAQVTVRVIPHTGEGVGLILPVEVPGGSSADLPLEVASGGDGAQQSPDGGQDVHGLDDGIYTVIVESDVPVVAAVRASTAVDPGVDATTPDAPLDAPPSDLAWFSTASVLQGPTLIAVADSGSPLLSLANPSGADATVEVVPIDPASAPVSVTVPAGGGASVAVAPGVYRLDAAAGLVAGVSFWSPGRLAASVFAPPRPVADSIAVRPE